MPALRNIIPVCLLLLSLCGYSQQKVRVLQLSGVVMVSDSLYPAPYVSVIRSRDTRGTYTDRDGYFTLPVIAGDTLRFYCTGLHPSEFVVPPDRQEHHLSMVQVMEMDTITLPTVYILPYPAPYQLKRELLALDLPGDAYRAFSRDAGDIRDYDRLADFSGRSYREAAATLQARYNEGFRSGGNLLNPSAWSSFIRSVRSEDAPGRQ